MIAIAKQEKKKFLFLKIYEKIYPALQINQNNISPKPETFIPLQREIPTFFGMIFYHYIVEHER